MTRSSFVYLLGTFLNKLSLGERFTVTSSVRQRMLTMALSKHSIRVIHITKPA